jgi:hypothetical protein
MGWGDGDGDGGGMVIHDIFLGWEKYGKTIKMGDCMWITNHPFIFFP